MFTACVYNLYVPLFILVCFVYGDIKHGAGQAVYAVSSVCAIAIVCQQRWMCHQV